MIVKDGERQMKKRTSPKRQRRQIATWRESAMCRDGCEVE
jgi:hypothetical protein